MNCFDCSDIYRKLSQALMEIISIETNAFRLILKKIDSIYNLLSKEIKENEMEQLMDNDSLCKTLKISKSTSQRLRSKSKLLYFKDGRKILYRKVDVANYIEAHKYGDLKEE